ncbi:MAG: hypothetical protein OXD47_00690, partial [Gammaproteobacteria bacterium]|nr:hypothetical protein [Gammaproteobacteria bacterium]MCY4337299.1 hypothetical protein [Gammaproteobacteria bacterium]
MKKTILIVILLTCTTTACTDNTRNEAAEQRVRQVADEAWTLVVKPCYKYKAEKFNRPYADVMRTYSEEMRGLAMTAAQMAYGHYQFQ